MEKAWVRFGYADRKVSVAGKRKLQGFIADLVLREKGIPCRLQYVFCSDAHLLQMNIDFLQHDTYTDIITFDLSANPDVCIEGEIYISIDRVKENAREHGVPFLQELCRVLFHGALHLTGYGDKTRKEVVIMRQKEEEYLKLYGLL